MRLLFDTHTFIWWDSDSEKLSPDVLALCQDQANELLLSVASVWEMQIKMQLGKLQLKLPLNEIITTQQKINNIQVIPITMTHVLALDSLPLHHKDPFDRLLIAQSNIENAVLISRDKIFERYSVNWVW